MNGTAGKVAECTRCHMLLARHLSLNVAGPDANLCCTCHVTTGGVPLNWHPECLDTWRKIMEEASGNR